MTSSRFQETCIGLAALLVLATLALLPQLAFGQPQQPGPMRFGHVTMEQGLSQADVMTVMQDSVGYMWFGTENGLNRFDGYEIRRYYRGHGDARGLSHDFIWKIQEDRTGNLWLATDGGGVARWNRATDDFTSYRHDPADAGTIGSNNVRTLVIDADGILWIGTRDRGLDRLDPGTGRVTHFRHDASRPSSLSNDNIYALFVDSAGQLWVGTDGGLNRLDRASGEFTRYRNSAALPGSLSDDHVRAIFRDSHGTLWVGTERGGLNELNSATGTFRHHRHSPASATSLSHDHVRAILEDADGRLWVGTANGLDLMLGESGAFVRFVHEDADPTSLRDSYIMSLHQDRGGMLWVGTRSGGVSKWNPRSWSLGYSDAKWLGNAYITAFADDGRGRVWIGTFGSGLGLIDRSRGDMAFTTRMYRHGGRGGSLSDDRVMALLVDREGMLWIGTMGGGLNLLDPADDSIATFRHDPADPTSLSADAVMTLFEDRDGNIWIGTFGGGLCQYDRSTRTFTRFAADPSNPTSLASPRVTAIAQDDSGAIWVGTDGGGLNLLDGETGAFHRYRHDPGRARTLSADTVFALHVDQSGNIWVGTQGGGLDRVVGSASRPEAVAFANLSEAEGLPNNVVYGIHSDPSGDLWLSTNAGLARFDPGTGRIKSLRRSHGLQGDEFNFGAHYRGQDGTLYFGGADGYNALDPKRLEEGHLPPPVVLTAFEKMNRPVETGAPYDRLSTAVLEHDDRVVTFEMAALDYNAPGENRYTYMLEGFDSGWMDLGNERRVTYTNLDAGDYVFRARAISSDGIESDEGLSIALRVKPAPWATWWAYTAYGMVILLALAAALRSRRRKRLRDTQYREQLEREVQERTGELAERNDELRALNAKLTEASLTDPLTGLRNRRFVFEQVTKDVALIQRQLDDTLKGKPAEEVVDLVFMLVDLDHFKPINDTFGHASGDEVLIQVRDVLLSACRSSDFVVRWGGDEFLVIARHTNAEDAELLAERIRQRMAEKVFPLDSGHVVHSTCSIGFVCYPLLRDLPDSVALDDVLNLVDSAMYDAKRQRNAWVGYLRGEVPASAATIRSAFKAPAAELARDGMLLVRRSWPATVAGDRNETGRGSAAA